MWISLSSQKPFAIKIYVGGINAVSGEPAVETELTIKRRVTLLNNSKPVQDYVVTPDQHWLDGIASEDGNVRQFVAVPTGSGYSVEAQITGHDHIAGLQFEVTPVHKPVRRERKPGDVKIFIKPFWGETIPFWCSKSEGIGPIEEMIKERFGIPPQLQRFSVHPEDQHHDHPDAKKTTYRFSGYDISEVSSRLRTRVNRIANAFITSQGVVVRFREELIGGGGYSHEMTIGAGGKIRQTIRPDTNSPSIWDIDSTTTFNVQILNSATYQSVTGKPPPVSSITYASYAKHGYPFYAFYNEMPTDIKGDFTGVKSVNDLDSAGKQTDEKVRASAEVNESLHGPVVLLDMNGRRRGFRPVSELEKEVKSVRSFFSGL